MAEYFRVKEAFAYGNAVAPAGEIWSDDNPAYKGREQFFEPVGAAAARSTAVATETADARPGRLRGRSKRLTGDRPKPETKPEPKPEAPAAPAEKE